MVGGERKVLGADGEIYYVDSIECRGWGVIHWTTDSG